MHRSHRSLFTYLFLGIAAAIACGPQPIDVPEDEDDDDDDNGGNSGTGATGVGGSFGGTFSGGGTYATGGTPPSGGVAGVQAGGVAGVQAGGVAGVQATGGFPTGGAAGAAAGAFPTGGVSGTPATGGAAGTAAGAAGAAGSGTVSCDAAFAVGMDGFVRAPGASGCWHGYASAGGDTGTTVMPTSFAMCGMGCMLRVTGTVGPATSANSYAGVMYMGFNVNQATGSTAVGTIAPTGAGLAVTFTKTTGPATIRVQISSGSAATTRWCANLTTSGAVIPYAMFNTQCWDMMGTAYAKQPIDTVQIIIPGPDAAMGAAFDVTLVSVKDT
jgi:hypothetical protein